MTVDVRALLSQATNTVERPPVLPQGHFHGTVLRSEFDKSRQKKTPLIRFYLNPTSAGDDVAEEDMEGINLKAIELRYEFYLTPKSMYRLSDFLDALLGEAEGSSFDERIPEVIGAACLIGVRQRLDDDGKAVGNDITTVTADA